MIWVGSMKTHELIDHLKLSADRYGDLDVCIYVNGNVKFEIDAAEACSNRDHFLIVVGPLIADPTKQIQR